MVLLIRLILPVIKFESNTVILSIDKRNTILKYKLP